MAPYPDNFLHFLRPQLAHMMDASNKSDQNEGRTSLAYQDESDDERSLLSDGGRDVAAADLTNPRENPESRKKRPWARMLGALGLRRAVDDLPYYELHQRGRGGPRPKPRSRRCMCSCLKYFVAFVCGIVTIILIKVLLGERVLPKNPKFWPEWGQPGEPGDHLAHYPHDITRGILPVPCHSHNDYSHDIPLWDAIHSGCTSIEANVWYVNGFNELLVGADNLNLTPGRTFKSLYINPLFDILDQRNPKKRKVKRAEEQGVGLYETDPTQTLVLLVDFKNFPNKSFEAVESQIEVLHEAGYLAYFDVEANAYIDGAITVVVSGNAPFDLITENKKHRIIFFDAPLKEFSLKSPNKASSIYDSTNSYSASASMREAVGFPWFGYSSGQIDKLRDQVGGAQKAGLKTRYRDIPAWPTALRNYVWETLVREGVDYLSVDDLQAVTKGIWGAWG